jgi:hypothetical protein
MACKRDIFTFYLYEVIVGFLEVLYYNLSGGSEDKPGKIPLKIDGLLAESRRSYLQNSKTGFISTP